MKKSTFFSISVILTVAVIMGREPPAAWGQEVKTMRCWSCQRTFQVPASAERGSCPFCGKNWVIRVPSPVPGPSSGPPHSLFRPATPDSERVYAFSGNWTASQATPPLGAGEALRLELSNPTPDPKRNLYLLEFRRAAGLTSWQGTYDVLGPIIYLYDADGDLVGKGDLAGGELAVVFLSPREEISSARFTK